jgi:ribonuclease P protein subunit POP4
MAPAPKDGVAQSLLSRAHSPTSAARILTEKIKTRPLHLKPTDPTPDPRQRRHVERLRKEQQKKRKLRPAPLSARTKRALGIYDIPKSEQKYSIYEPLHQMWIGYIQEVLGPNCMPVSSATTAKLVSADYHGAELEVVRSRCVGRVGTRGIVVKDTKFTFEIVTKANELKIMPKEHTVFRFDIPPLRPSGSESDIRDGGNITALDTEKNLVFELHGDQFQHRAVDRANKKFKPHHFPDL